MYAKEQQPTKQQQQTQTHTHTHKNNNQQQQKKVSPLSFLGVLGVSFNFFYQFFIEIPL